MSYWNLQKYIDHCYILNLKTSPKRYQQTLDELQLIGYPLDCVTRFEGVDGRNTLRDDDDVVVRNKSNEYMLVRAEEIKKYRKSSWGTSIGHYNIIKDAQSKGYQSVLILEDDNMFGHLDGTDSYKQISCTEPNLKGTGPLFQEMMESLPSDWIMFYLNHACWGQIGAKPEKYYQFVPHTHNMIELIGKSCLMNCYILHQRGYQPILDKLSVLLPGHSGEVKAADVLLGELQRQRYQATGKSNIYGAFPTMLACQRPSNGSSVSQFGWMIDHYFAGGYNIISFDNKLVPKFHSGTDSEKFIKFP